MIAFCLDSVTDKSICLEMFTHHVEEGKENQFTPYAYELNGP